MTLVGPRCIKGNQRSNDCSAALGKFVSKSAERCKSFFKALKLSGKTFQWNEDCTKAWKDIKSYLVNLPLLCAPTPGEALYMYLSVSQQVVDSILIRESKDKQLPVYFISRVLRGAEVRYSYIEKLAYTLVISTRKLQAYFKSHPVTICTIHPLK